MALAAGIRLGRYESQGALGAGGVNRSLCAEHSHNRRRLPEGFTDPATDRVNIVGRPMRLRTTLPGRERETRAAARRRGFLFNNDRRNEQDGRIPVDVHLPQMLQQLRLVRRKRELRYQDHVGKM